MSDDAAIARSLATWYAKAARDLTWRGTRDPYRIWVSEVMCQQTRVETVEAYYPEFLRRFPTLEALAQADEEEVLEAWSGLGYYRRARFLHRGARYVRDELDGTLPPDPDKLRTIPGVGPYTVGALSSIAFDLPVPLVDGNVARVSSRVRGVEDPAQQPATAKAHWRWVEDLYAHGRPRVLGQALMELGATVCTPRNPTCLDCPIRSHCVAQSKGIAHRIPAPKKKKASPEFRYFALAVTWGERLMLERRPDDGLLARMWCLPLREDVDAEAIAAELRDWIGPTEPEVVDGPPVKHVFSHRVWHLRPLRLRAKKRPSLKGRDAVWLEPDALPEGGIPTVTRKLLERLGR